MPRLRTKDGSLFQTCSRPWREPKTGTNALARQRSIEEESTDPTTTPRPLDHETPSIVHKSGTFLAEKPGEPVPKSKNHAAFP